MVQTKELLCVDYVTDTEISGFSMGDVDYGLRTGVIDDFLKKYGKRGKEDLLGTLKFVTEYIERMEISE